MKSQKEIDMLKDLNHPNIVKLLDCLQIDNQTSLVLEFIESGSLSDSKQ